jgi:hypothetical protein
VFHPVRCVRFYSSFQHLTSYFSSFTSFAYLSLLFDILFSLLLFVLSLFLSSPSDYILKSLDIFHHLSSLFLDLLYLFTSRLSFCVSLLYFILMPTIAISPRRMKDSQYHKFALAIFNTAVSNLWTASECPEVSYEAVLKTAACFYSVFTSIEAHTHTGIQTYCVIQP